MHASGHSFESQASPQTLRQGLDEYYSHNPTLMRGSALSAAARSFFYSHDVAHVVYGCGTSLSDELVVKVSSVFGTTAGLGVLRGYGTHEAYDIYRTLSVPAALLTAALSVFLVPRTVWRCLRQVRRWPWEGFEPLLGLPLSQLRAEFGIKVSHFTRK